MRIGICGTSCAGKTTLARALSKRLNLPLINEVAEDFKEFRNTIPTQFNIASGQIGAEINMVAAHGGFVSDRTVLDNLAYSSFHYSHLQPTKFDTTLFDFIGNMVDDYLTTRPYDLIVFADEYFDLEDDGNRSMSLEEQFDVYYLIDDIANYVRLRFNIPIVYVSGPLDERIQKIINSMQVNSR